jgi:glutamate racemase
LAPVIRDRKGDGRAAIKEARVAGYARVRIDGSVYTLDEADTLSLDRQKRHTVEVVVDRYFLDAKPDRSRLLDSLETAVTIGNGIIIVADTETKEELLLYTRELITFLAHQEVDYYVNACNSISTLDAGHILEEYAIDAKRYFDMKDFAQRVKENIENNARVLIFATNATIESGVYQEVFSDYSPEVLPSSLLAKAIEEGDLITIDEEVDRLVDYVLDHGITHVFLGCTHYPLISQYLDKRFSDTGVICLNPAEYIPEELLALSGDEKSLTVVTTKQIPAYAVYLEDITEDVVVKEISLTS